MYGEEILISEVVRKYNKLVIYEPKFQVIHNENQVTGHINLRKKQKWFKNSFNYLKEKFY